ncbi:ABC transporter ATP-binding protein [Microbacterium murale]|uniref:ABC transporter domain-containing protein n=1 Tax=Microbacterium murale TaxID=1081040 RepID=A0ABQ1RDP8_9MICO|nr:ABC transporter ATP-binding protein [Microbacterium murale]GGD67105.1 hypothetical protein GCM10007269_07820 [Microbacterium murale]
MTLAVDIRARVGGFTLEAAIAARAGEVLAVLGPNGSGKSTLLGAIAGHLPMVDGSIALNSRALNALPPERRRIGLLGQRAMLFPHLTALENIAFGPRAQGVSRTEARDAAHEWLAEVGLAEFALRRPAQLSGGQQQRVALARALAAKPDALLLDEPFAALDVQTATQARRLIREQRDRIGIPIVLVTHDAMDAVVLASRTVVLNDGRVVQQGETREVLGHPNSPFVAAIAGVNLVTGIADGDGLLQVDAGDASVPGSGIRWIGLGDPLAPGEAGTAVFSPGAVRLRPVSESDGGTEQDDGTELFGQRFDPLTLAQRVSSRSARSTSRGSRSPNTWTGTVAHFEAIPGGVRLFTAEHPDIAVDCSSMIAVDAGVRPDAVLSFSIDEQDVSVRRSL